jgi:hypothetical protein
MDEPTKELIGITLTVLCATTVMCIAMIPFLWLIFKIVSFVF